MYRLDRFNLHHEPLRYTMPWARIITSEYSNHPFVVNKDGSFQTTFKYRGPDLDSAIREQLSVITQQLNSVIMGITTGWVLYFEAQRVQSTKYPTVSFPDPISQAIDDERRAFFSKGGTHFETFYYCTMCWMPPSDNEGRLRSIVVEGKKKFGFGEEDYLDIFGQVVDRLFHSFYAVNIPCEFLTADQMLTYLYSTISTNSHPINLPKQPLLLDNYLFDTPLSGGLEPKLGDKYLRVISVIGYLQSSVFGMFNPLNMLDFSYRWISRFYCLEKQDAISALTGKKKQWQGKFKSLPDMIKEMISGRESDRHIDESVMIKYQEAGKAITATESDLTSYGYYSTDIVLLGETAEDADAKAKTVVQSLVNMGFRAKVEDLNAVDAWMGTLPGNFGRNIRRDLISIGNLIHMMPLSTIWAGDERNEHLQGPALLYTQTAGNTPYRLNLHVGDVGHTLVVGPTGAGKSVLLNMIEASFRKYENARVFVFDKGCSSMALTYGVGGTFYDLGNEEKGSLSFEPLAHVDDDKERQWALEWLCDYVRQENLEVTPERKKLLWDALESVASYQDISLRRMTTLVNSVQSQELKTALQPLTVTGSYGRIFDSPEDTLKLGSWQTFEMEKLMATPAIVGPTLMYIFHKIEQSLTGDPTIIVLDECWVFFDNEQFAQKIREWLKVLRKSNASVIFATQSLNDIVSSPIFATVLESCPSRIFLPNTDALEEGISKQYGMFGLNKRQIQIIASAIKKKQYYYVSPFGSRLFDLALEHCPVSLAYVAVNTKQIRKGKELVAQYGKENFNTEWLKYRHIL